MIIVLLLWHDFVGDQGTVLQSVWKLYQSLLDLFGFKESLLIRMIVLSLWRIDVWTMSEERHNAAVNPITVSDSVESLWF